MQASGITVLSRNPRSLHWWISVALAMLGSLTAVALTLQAYQSQGLVEHRIWREVLESVSNTYLEQRALNPMLPTPHDGILRSWLVAGDRIPSDMPGYLRSLRPGYYTSEGHAALEGTGEKFHALVTQAGEGRLVAVIDIAEFEAQQNYDAMVNGAWGIALVLLIGGLIVWLHLNLVRPVKDLARKILAIDPAVAGQRLPMEYRQEELRVIAQANNAHLERVENFIARERSLLEQASHEFRTPVAVISGAVDLLNQQGLPESTGPALQRISGAVDILSETMVSLLYLSREQTTPNWQEFVALHDLLPVLLVDHEHLYANKQVELRVGEMQPTFILAPESMVRIAVGNLIRNAIENTCDGLIEISLRSGVICISDSGKGFDAAEAARRYRESIRNAVPARGQGLGMFLISRICDRFQWRLSIESRTGQGTRARLDVNASVIGTDDQRDQAS